MWLKCLFLGIALFLAACAGGRNIDPYLVTVVDKANAELAKANADNREETQMSFRFDGGKLLLTMRVMKLKDGNLPEEAKQELEAMKVVFEKTTGIIIEVLKMKVNANESILTDEFFSRLKNDGIEVRVVIQARNGDVLAKIPLNLDNTVVNLLDEIAKAQRGGKEYESFQEKPSDKVFMVDGFSAVKIGEQVWMAENLNIETPGSKCYDDNPKLCNKGGRLYTIDEAASVCPAGWHLPDTSEFGTLLRNAGDVKRLLSANYDEWSETYVGTDDFGFRLRSSGRFDGRYFQFGHLEGSSERWLCFNCVRAYLWTSTVPRTKSKYWNSEYWNSEKKGYFASFPEYEIESYSEGKRDKGVALSVRCVHGEPALKKRQYETFIDTRDNRSYKKVEIGSQTWMAENLKFKTESSLCFNNDESRCDEYGRYYSRSEAQTVCPAGWHLPDTTEFRTLLESAGKVEPLLSYYVWPDSGVLTDDSRYNILPAGRCIVSGSSEKEREISCDEYYYDGRYTVRGAFLWTSTNSLKVMNEYGDTDLGYYVLFPKFLIESYSQTPGLSDYYLPVRCVMGDPAQKRDPYELQTFLDARDNRTYKAVTIGKQTWMAENLNYNADSSSCYNDEEANCNRFGRLYLGTELNGVCPAGWHLPSTEEWDTLYTYVEGLVVTLLSKDVWREPGMDAYNFAVLPGGSKFENRYQSLIDNAFYWTSTRDPYRETAIQNVTFMLNPLRHSSQNQPFAGMLHVRADADKSKYSVRCVRDE